MELFNITYRGVLSSSRVTHRLGYSIRPFIEIRAAAILPYAILLRALRASLRLVPLGCSLVSLVTTPGLVAFWFVFFSKRKVTACANKKQDQGKTCFYLIINLNHYLW